MKLSFLLLLLLVALTGCKIGSSAYGHGSGSTYIHINKITDKIYEIREIN
jgi:hypothetical protein